MSIQNPLAYVVGFAFLIVSLQISTTHSRGPRNPKPRIKIGPLSQIQKSLKIQAQEGAFKGMKCCVMPSYPCLKDTDCCSSVCRHTSQIAGEKRKVRKPSGTKKTTKTQTSAHREVGPSIIYPATRGMTRQVSMPSHSPLPTQHHSSRYPQNSQPLIGDKLVIAKGSQRALILTHGGIRCNEFIREVEQSIVECSDM